MNPKDKVEDIAAGQRAFLDKYLPEEKTEKDLQAKIIKLSVEAYILEAESAKKDLLQQVETEKKKNAVVKDLAEQLARELLHLSPNHPLAEETLALLLENKMRTGDKKKR